MTADMDPTSDEGMRRRALKTVPILFVGALALFIVQRTLSAAPTQVSYLGIILVLACTFWVANRRQVFEETLLCGGAFGWGIFCTLWALGIVVV